MKEMLLTDVPALNELWSHGWFRCLVTIAVGIGLSILLKRIFRPVNRKLPRQAGILMEKAVLTLLWVFVVVHALRAVGVDLISVLGAAGVAGIAIGFAAQTALSNLISGIFIMSEQSIRIGCGKVVRDGAQVVRVIKDFYGRDYR